MICRTIILCNIVLAISNVSLQNVVADKSAMKLVNSTYESWFGEIYNVLFNRGSHSRKARLNYSCIFGRAPCCKCDENCWVRRDCCADKLFSTEPQQVDRYLDSLILKSVGYSQFQCASVLENINKDYTVQRVAMIAQCSLNYFASPQVIYQCEQGYIHNSTDVSYAFPVAGEDGNIYRNRYCAECNRVPVQATFNISFTQCHDIREDEHDLGEFLKKAQGCLVKLNIKPQIKAQIVVCPSNNRAQGAPTAGFCSAREHKLCLSYRALAFSANNSLFLNPSCLRCVHGTSSTYSGDECRMSSKTSDGIAFVRTEFSLLVSYHNDAFWSLLLNQQSFKEMKCPDGLAYDLRLGVCIPRICGPGFALREGKCVADDIMNSIVDQEAYKRALTCATSNGGVAVLKVDLTSSNASEHSLDPTCGVNMDRPTPYLYLLNSSTTLNYLIGDKNSMFYIIRNISVQRIPDIFYDIQSLWTCFKISMVMTPHSHSLWTYTYGISLERLFGGEKYCFDVIDVKENITLAQNCSSIDSTGNIYSSSLRQGTITYVVQLQQSSPGHVSYYTCKMFHLIDQCQKRKIKPNSFLAGSNNSIVVQANGKHVMFQPWQYRPLEGGIEICKIGFQEAFNIYPWEEELLMIEDVVSIVLAIFSAFCLALTIAIYCGNLGLRNTPGKNLVCLCCSVLTSDLIIVTSIWLSSCTVCCKIAGITLHASALAISFWSLIISVDLFLTFTNDFRQRSRHGKKFATYNLLCWSTVMLIVALSVTMDQFTGIMRYGKGGICWIVSISGRTIFYFIPSTLVYLTNIILLVTVLFKLKRTNSMSGTLLGSSKARQAQLTMMALKIIILLGFVELIGLVQIHKDDEISKIITSLFRFIYTVIRSSRGSLIFLVYVYGNNRAWEIVKGLNCLKWTFTRRIHSSRSSAGSTSSGLPMVPVGNSNAVLPCPKFRIKPIALYNADMTHVKILL